MITRSSLLLPYSHQGSFTISVVDTVLDNCGNVAIFNSKTVFISLNQVTPSASPASICEGDQTTLTTNLASTPGYTFPRSPGNSTAPTITVSLLPQPLTRSPLLTPQVVPARER
ncbi:MAG: hypothetical protein R3C61_28310 [Bacteroidia bacterium]